MSPSRAGNAAVESDALRALLARLDGSADRVALARDLGMSDTEVDVALERLGEAGFLMAAAPRDATAAKL